jgi:hypothetical protein
MVRVTTRKRTNLRIRFYLPLAVAYDAVGGTPVPQHGYVVCREWARTKRRRVRARVRCARVRCAGEHVARCRYRPCESRCTVRGLVPDVDDDAVLVRALVWSFVGCEHTCDDCAVRAVVLNHRSTVRPSDDDRFEEHRDGPHTRRLAGTRTHCLVSEREGTRGFNTGEGGGERAIARV